MNKIAVITPFLARGGLEKVAITQAKLLSEFYDVTLIVLDSFIQDYPFDGKMIDIGVSLENRGLLKRIVNMLVSIIRLHAIKRKHKFDLVISHGELANIPNIFSGGKLMVTVHENRFAGLKDMQGELVNKILKYLYTVKNILKIVTVSKGIKNGLIEKLNIDKYAVEAIHNPHDIEDIIKKSHEPLDEFEVLFRSPTLINVGRLVYQKGQWYLLRIYAETKKTNPTLKLVLLGDGYLRDELISLANALGLKTYSVWSDDEISDDYDVYFLGFQTNPFKFIAKSKIFVMTSISEGLPNTIIESLACGTPVVSTDCKTGPSEILLSEEQQHTAYKMPLLSEVGVLMPVFKEEKFIGAQTALSDVEKSWVDMLTKHLNEPSYSFSRMECVDRARAFEMNKIISQWKLLIDTNIHFQLDGERK